MAGFGSLAPEADDLPDVGEPLIPSGPRSAGVPWANRARDIASGYVGEQIKGAAHLAATPGAVMKPNPYPPGSEEADWYDTQRTEAAHQFGPAMGLAMATSGTGAETAGPREVMLGAGRQPIPGKAPVGAREAFGNWIEGLAGSHAPEATAGQRAAGTEAQVAAPAAAVPGGAGGREAGLGAAQIQAERIAGAHRPLPGLPINPLQVGDKTYVPGPIGKIKDIAESYMQGRLRSGYHTDPEIYHPLDPEHSRNIAQAYEEMVHEPDNPAVKASYQALVDETRAQYRHIRTNHPELQIVPNEAGVDPYAATPRLAARDVAENNRLHFFPTEQGFGTINKVTDNPMLQPSGETLNGKPLLNNDLFRIVHDYFGHLKEGYGFRAAGEDNAWRSHAAMYSDLARPAMTSETRGQNSWVNFGPHAEANKGASGADTIYADQKVGLMPEWTMRDRGSPEPITTWQGSPSAHSMVDMSRIGSAEGSGVFGHGQYSSTGDPLAEWYRNQLAARFDPLLKKYRLSQDQGSRLGIDIANSKGDHQAVVDDLNDHVENLKAQQAQGDTSMGVKNQIKNSQNMIKYMNDPNRFKGHLYQFAIDRPPEHFLDWDKPLSQQSDYVQQKLQPMIDSMDRRMSAARASLLAKAQARLAPDQPPLPPGPLHQKLEADIRRYSTPTDWPNMPGSKIYEMAAHESLGRAPRDKNEGYPISSQYLRSKGLAGVRYPSGSIHKRFEGFQNYATFDAPRILRRYAIPGALGTGLGASMMSRGQENGS